MKWFIAFIWLFANAALGQPVTVKSGEHDGFTRIVLTFPESSDWQLSRTVTGYEFQRPGRREIYDLSDVYRLIKKDRLKSLWADPASGHLQLGIDCECHAIPFEFDAKTLVIDIRDGAPPEGSFFERVAGSGNTLSPLGQALGREVQPTPAYNWLDGVTDIVSVAPASRNQVDLDAQIDADDFRSAVVDQLAKGATDGIIDIVPEGLSAPSLPSTIAAPTEPADNQELPPAPVPGVQVSDGRQGPPLDEFGGLCPAEEKVDLARWSVVDDWATALAASRNGILGEFDQANQDGIDLAVRTHLYLGFGAEARNIMQAFSQQSAIDPLALGISYLVDGQQPPSATFTGMQTCDSGAAFWSLAASLPQDTLAALNGKAVARTFLGLPPHLKQHFAQQTVEGLIRAGDTQNAEVVRAALTRAIPEDSQLAPLMDAQKALVDQEPEKAEALIENITDADLAAEALLALIDARFQQLKPVDERDVVALAAFASDFKSTTKEATYKKAMIRAQALAGDFAAAFQTADANPAFRGDVWMILLAVGQASDLLNHAVDSAGTEQDQISSATKAGFARRFIEMGLPNVAQLWMPDRPEDPMLMAEVALENKDGRMALRALSQDLSGADQKLLARAFGETGNFVQAAAVLRRAGEAEQAAQMERWANVWPADAPAESTTEAGAAEDNIWSRLAMLRKPRSDDPTLPALQASQDFLTQSVLTRDRISDLLAAVPPLTD